MADQTCPKCSGDMWDNRASKRNPKAPDFKCKDKSCDGVIWPPRDGSGGAPAAGAAAAAGGEKSCPKCGGKTWDNRLSKRNPKAPDYKCRDKSCDGVIWPPRDGSAAVAAPAAAPRAQAPVSLPPSDEEITDDYPF